MHAEDASDDDGQAAPADNVAASPELEAGAAEQHSAGDDLADGLGAAPDEAGAATPDAEQPVAKVKRRHGSAESLSKESLEDGQNTSALTGETILPNGIDLIMSSSHYWLKSSRVFLGPLST